MERNERKVKRFDVREKCRYPTGGSGSRRFKDKQVIFLRQRTVDKSTTFQLAILKR